MTSKWSFRQRESKGSAQRELNWSIYRAPSGKCKYECTKLDRAASSSSIHPHSSEQCSSSESRTSTLD